MLTTEYPGLLKFIFRNKSVFTVQGDSGKVVGNHWRLSNIYIMFYYLTMKILEIMFLKCPEFIQT